MMRPEVVLLAPPGDLYSSEISGVPVRQVGRFRGHAWEQLDLPFSLAKNFRGSTLLSLGNTAPVFGRHQFVTHHDVTYLRFPYSYPYRFRLAYRLLAKLTLPRARAIITVSEFSRRDIAEAYKLPEDRLHVVYNAVDEVFARGDIEVGSDPAKPYFLAVGSILPHKNIGLLLQAYSEYRMANPDPADLVLVGSRPAYSTFSAASDAEGVRWTGRVSDPELAVLYKEACALIFPSLYEGFGIPPVEAQALGCPVIASSAASMPEVLRDSALYFDPRDHRALAMAMGTVTADEQFRARLVAAGQENASRYSWRRSARRVLDVIEGKDA